MAVAQQQGVVLVGLEHLLAATLAAHHDQAAVGDQLGRRQQTPQAREQALVQAADEACDALDLAAAVVQQRQHGVDALGGGLQFGNRGGGIDLQGHDVRVVGDEGHQVELTEQAAYTGFARAVAHQQPVHAVPAHQPQGFEQLGVGMDLDQLEARHLAHCQHPWWLDMQQGIAQVGGGEDAQSRAIADQGIGQALCCQVAAHRHQILCAIDIERPAHIGVTHTCSHQREHLALRVWIHGIHHRTGSQRKTGLQAVCPQSRRLCRPCQCPDAPEAPMPVSERTCWAGKPARS